MTIRRALISVYDKTGLVPFAKGLTRLGFEILSTGGTAAALRKEKIAVTDVSDVTGFPEILEGRVKTLHPKIHGGILARRNNPEDQKAMRDLKIPFIDLVAVNLYPFESQPGVEMIDVGGPTMLRAAAKNYEHVVVVCDPADYDEVLAGLANCDPFPLEFRKRLAAKVFARTAEYEKAIAAWFSPGTHLRYGENPHQSAEFLALNGQPLDWTPLSQATAWQGKELSYNNILDADAALQLIREEFLSSSDSCAIIKHNNPCGVAFSKKSLAEAFIKAKACDPLSAFGGIAALNRKVDSETAEKMSELFLEVILAPGFSEEAKTILSKKKNLRLLVFREVSGSSRRMSYRSAGGGLLAQTSDIGADDSAKWLVKTKRRPTKAEQEAMQFAWTVCKHVRSNAIVFATGDRILGIGAGQTSRVDAVKVAIMKMHSPSLEGRGQGEGVVQGPIVVASDAFFPFPDGVLEAAKAGATAVIQPGGSVKDEEVIAAADQHNLAMIFTGTRHFRH